MGRYDIDITPQVVAKVRRHWPNAVRHTIRSEGKCPNCKQAGQISYQTPDDWDREQHGGWESCGYYCINCGWGNGGSRLIEPEE